MSVISGIVPATRPAGRFAVLVDGREVAVLTLEAIERLRLAVGRPATGLEDRIALEARRLQAYDRAVNLLAFRARSSSELARALQRKGEEKAHVEWAIARLAEQGLIDDAAFARSFARSKVVDGKQIEASRSAGSGAEGSTALGVRRRDRYRHRGGRGRSARDRRGRGAQEAPVAVRPRCVGPTAATIWLSGSSRLRAATTFAGRWRPSAPRSAGRTAAKRLGGRRAGRRHELAHGIPCARAPIAPSRSAPSRAAS